MFIGFVHTLLEAGNQLPTPHAGQATLYRQVPSMRRPHSIAFDWFNTMFVADPFANMVYRVQGTTVTPYAGTGVRGYSGDGT